MFNTLKFLRRKNVSLELSNRLSEIFFTTEKEIKSYSLLRSYTNPFISHMILDLTFVQLTRLFQSYNILYNQTNLLFIHSFILFIESLIYCSFIIVYLTNIDLHIYLSTQLFPYGTIVLIQH